MMAWTLRTLVAPSLILVTPLCPRLGAQSTDSGARTVSAGPSLEETKGFITGFFKDFARIGREGLSERPDEITWSGCTLTMRVVGQHQYKMGNLTLKYHPFTVTLDLSLLQPITSIAKQDGYGDTLIDGGVYLAIDGQFGKKGIIDSGGNWKGKPQESTVPREWVRFPNSEDGLRAQRALERALILCGAKATPY